VGSRGRIRNRQSTLENYTSVRSLGRDPPDNGLERLRGRISTSEWDLTPKSADRRLDSPDLVRRPNYTRRILYIDIRYVTNSRCVAGSSRNSEIPVLEGFRRHSGRSMRGNRQIPLQIHRPSSPALTATDPCENRVVVPRYRSATDQERRSRPQASVPILPAATEARPWTTFRKPTISRMRHSGAMVLETDSKLGTPCCDPGRARLLYRLPGRRRRRRRTAGVLPEGVAGRADVGHPDGSPDPGGAAPGDDDPGAGSDQCDR
jgi:hypothetical protein